MKSNKCVEIRIHPTDPNTFEKVLLMLTPCHTSNNVKFILIIIPEFTNTHIPNNLAVLLWVGPSLLINMCHPLIKQDPAIPHFVVVRMWWQFFLMVLICFFFKMAVKHVVLWRGPCRFLATLEAAHPAWIRQFGGGGAAQGPFALVLSEFPFFHLRKRRGWKRGPMKRTDSGFQHSSAEWMVIWYWYTIETCIEMKLYVENHTQEIKYITCIKYHMQ